MRWMLVLAAAATLRAECTVGAGEALWTVQVRALTRQLTPMESLTAAGLRLTANRRPVPICRVTPGPSTAAIAIVMDVSRSMRSGPVDGAVLMRAGIEKLLELAATGDEFALIYSGTRSAVAVPLTRDTARIRTAIAAPASGGSALLDGIDQALNELRGAGSTTRAVVVFSDADDNNSGRGSRQIERAAMEARAAVFVVAPRGLALPRSPSEPDSGPERVRSVARESGGLMVEAGDTKETQKVVGELAAIIRATHRIQFVQPGRDVRVKVEFSDKRLRGTLLYRPAAEDTR